MRLRDGGEFSLALIVTAKNLGLPPTLRAILYLGSFTLRQSSGVGNHCHLGAPINETLDRETPMNNLSDRATLNATPKQAPTQ